MIRRWLYKRAMINSMRIACHDELSKIPVPLTNGLRCIRSFERVNGIAFDPFDKEHNLKISGGGSHEQFFRKAKKLLTPTPTLDRENYD